MAFKDIFTSDDTMKVPPENRLDLAVTALSKYYMSTASETELKNYKRGNSSDDKSIAEEKLNARKESSEVKRKLRSLIQDTSMGGLFVNEIIRKVEEDTVLKSYKGIQNILKVKFESHAPGVINSTVENDNDRGINAQCGQLIVQSPAESPDDSAQAAADAVSGDSDGDGDEPAGIVNSVVGGNASGIPDAINNPWLSAILVNDSTLTPGNNRNVAGSLFFNSIPTTEMSQCSPFIKITFITENDNFLDGARSMTLQGFTKASDTSMWDWSTGKNIDWNTLSLRRDAGFDVSGEVSAAAISEEAPANSALREFEGLTIDATRVISSGIELFQAPQTLNNLGVADDPALGGALNPSAPLASLQRLSIDISGLGLSTLCNKTASMEFILHDRSQMRLIAPIVGASSFAGTHVEIEYGWMHPQASFAQSGNVYANFLNSLRSKSLFNIQVADLSVLEDGQVRVNLKLASRGAAEMNAVPAASGVSKVSAAMIAPFLNKVLSQMSHMKSKSFQESQQAAADAESASEYVAAAARTADRELLDIQRGFSAQANFNTPRAMIDLGLYRELLSNLRSGASSVAQSAAISSAIEIINDIMTTADEDQDSSGARVTLASELEAKRAMLERLDIFDNGTNTPVQEVEAEDRAAEGAAPVDANAEDASTNRGTISPTLGSVLLTYIGRPLQAIGKWDEVQMIFYPFNYQAGAMTMTNIANFRLTGFPDFLMKIIDERPFCSTAQFAEKLFKDACGPETISHPNYWGDEAYARVDQEALRELGTREERLEAIQDVRLANEAALSRIYSTRGRELAPEFEVPDITMLTECVPAKSSPEGQSKSILRIHVFDAKAGVPIEANLLSQIVQGNELAIRVKPEGIQPSSDASEEDEADQGTVAESESDEAAAEQLAGIVANDEVGQGESDATDAVPVPHTLYISKISAEMIKDAIKSVYPSITFGSQFTNVFSFGMSSNTGGAVNQVLLLNAIEQNRDEDSGPQRNSNIDDVFVIPTNATLQTAGFPNVTYGQKYYIDMGTGTTADNFYYVVGIRHTLTPGSYETTLTLTYNGSGTSRSLRTAMSTVAGVVYPGDSVG